MKTNILNTMKQFAKYICAVVVMLGMSVSAWGTSSSFDVSSITLNSVDWGTSTTYLQKYIGYDNGSIVTANNSNSVWFQFTIGDEFNNDYLYAFVTDHTDGFGLTIDGVDSNSGYVGYVAPSSSDYSVGDNVAITLCYVISAPRTSHTATLKFCRYDYDDPSADEYGWVAVLSVPVTINMTGGYVISTAVDPSATGSMTAKVNGSARTRVMSNERLDLVATPADGYQFLGWTTDGDEDTDWEIDNDMSASTYAYIHANQTITANFEVACTSHTISLTNSGTGTNGTFSADKSSACEDATITLTATPSSGYELDEWTVSKAGGGTCTVDGSNQFSMPDVNVTVNATFKAATYSLSFNANGGSGSMDAVDRVYNSTAAIPANTFIAPTGKVFDGWATSLGGDKVYNPGANYTMGAGDATLYAHWRNGILSDYKFSCADWSVTGPSGDTVFITSTASKTVRSQEAFHVTASGLPTNTALTFETFPANTRYAFKAADGSALTTDAYGKIDEDFYVFYTPKADDSSDGLDELTSLTVSVTGEPRTATIDTKRIIGRHLPTNFVIAAKRNNQWYALPSNMSSTSNPSMVEIAVDDADNPSIAYTATSNMYSLYDQSAGEYIKFAMKGQSDAPLFGYSSTASIGKSGSAIVTSTLGDGYLWKLVQSRAEGLSNAEDAKYTIYSKNNSTNHLRLKENAGNPIWGLYDSGIDELRLIPASAATVVEAYFIEYGATGGIIEVDANGISATKVKAKFNGNESSLITLNQTLTSVNGSATKYNYTVTFDGSVNFATNDAVGKILMLEWYNSSDVLVGVTSIEMPKIIASSSTMSSINGTKGYWKDLEVHVLPGATLTVNTGSFSNAVTIDHLEIYPGATVSVAPAGTAGTLTVGTLVLRNGWRRVGAKRYDVARLYLQPTIDASHQAASLVHTNAYSDWYIDFDRYYSIAVPFPVTISEMRYKNSNTAVTVSPTGTVRMRYYDGQNCVDKNKDNWKYYGTDTTRAVPNQLVPDSAYAITARRPTGKAFSIIRMPMTFNDAWTTGGELGTATISATTYRKDTIRVTAYQKREGTTPEQSKGWNYIANPFMSLYSGYLSYGVDDNIEYVNIPDSCFEEFTQLPMNGTSKLRPATGVLIQAPKTGRITFGATNRAASAPSYRNEEQPDYTPIQRAYIQLGNESTNDLMGLLISSRYSAEYEINADLQKLLGDGNVLRTYMLYNDIEMAYLAINEQLAQEWIPITIRIPTDGEYTFSMHEASVVGNIEGVYLIDYSNEQVTNLIEEDYTFNTTSGTISGRFAINAIAGQHETPTDIDIIQGGGNLHSDQPFKFLYHDKVFIYHRGVIYDATGKKVREINK